MSDIKILASGQNGPKPDAKPIASIPAEVTAAAKLLGDLPKQKIDGRRRAKRKWTGFIQGQRCWQGRLVILPDGRIVELHRAFRDMALVRITQDGAGAASRLIVIPTNSLKLFKQPAAVILGRRKLGVREENSLLKAEACRQNGKQPVRPGSRKRGRPRKGARNWQKFVLKSRNELRPNMTMNALLKLVVKQDSELRAAVKAAAAKDLEKAQRRARLAGIQHV